MRSGPLFLCQEKPLLPILEKRAIQNWLWITPLAVILVLFVRPHATVDSRWADESRDVAGIVLITIGIWLRINARGWKAQSQGNELLKDGLYSYIRHPLYVASFTIGLGIALIIGSGIFLAAFVVLFLAGHIPVVLREEADLRRRFGAEHTRYVMSTPALAPRPRDLMKRRPVVPPSLLSAVRLEADAILLWGLAAIGSDIWRDVAILGSRQRDIWSIVWGATACAVVGFWLYLKTTRKKA